MFGGSGTPNGFEFVVAIDWFLDRCITALNVTGDTVVSAIIADRVALDDNEHLPDLNDGGVTKEQDMTTRTAKVIDDSMKPGINSKVDEHESASTGSAKYDDEGSSIYM